MKTYVLGFIALGLTSLMSAQNEIAALTVSNNTIHSKSKVVKNMDYLTLASHDDISNKIKNIQQVVANYNIKESDVYASKSNTTYDVSFKEGDNTVAAVYDNEGQLISCKENYQAIKLPYSVSSKLSKEYPNWSFKNVACDIVYIKDQESSIAYHIVLKQGHKSKRITITI